VERLRSYFDDDGVVELTGLTWSWMRLANLRARGHRSGGAVNKKPLFSVGTALTAVILTGHPNPICAASAIVSFQEDVFPIFKGRCIECHQPGGQGYEKSGLDLRTYEGLMKGTKYGSMVSVVRVFGTASGVI